MNLDLRALAEAATMDTESRLARIGRGETLGTNAELNAAFLCGWRFAMKQMKAALEASGTQSDAGAKP